MATRSLQTAHDALLDQVHSLKEELAAKNRRLERKKRLEALGRVAAGVAHEFRNPLGGIRLTVDALLGDQPTERAQKRLEHVQRATTHLDRIVQDLLTFTRSAPLERHPVPVPELLEAVLEIAFPAGLDRELVTRGDDDVHCVVDRHAFSQVLVNLLTNARQAIGERDGRLYLQWGVRDDRVWFEVADDGDGIAPEDEESIYHPFHSKREGGTGLGLAIVHDRVEAHDGEISVVSDTWGDSLGWKGACFRVALPLDPNANGGAEERQSRGGD